MSAIQPQRSAEDVLSALRRWAGEDIQKQEIADQLGIPPSTLSRYISGDRRPGSGRSLQALAARIPQRFFPRPALRPLPETPRVFVSSTYLDNVKRRERVLDAILRAGCQPIVMEHWTASERPTVEECLARVAQADLFVGILAWRYGWIPEGRQHSITELEYEEAKAQGLDRLIFVVDSRLSEVNVERDFDQGPERWALQQRLDAFKARVRSDGGTPTPFDDEHLSVKVLQALNGWMERRGKRPAAPRAETLPTPSTAIEDYFAYLVQEHGFVRLAGFATHLRIPLAFDELYVPLDLARSAELGQGYQDLEQGWREAEARPSPTLASALARLFDSENGDRIAVLLGHPGAGKTTQLWRVALLLAREGPGALKLPADVVPLFLPLRALKPEHGSLKDLARHLLGDPHLGLDPDLVDELFAGSLLFLLDGLDEVPAARRAEVRGWIQSSVGNPKSRALVSCRFHGYVGDARFPESEADALELRPLTDPQRDAFVHNWYLAVETSLAKREEADASGLARARSQAEQQADDLLARLQERRATRVYSLAANPLLLTAICLVHRDRGHMPERRVDLYDECVDGLLELWRERQRIGFPLTFKAAQARQVLQPLALWLHEVEGRTRAKGNDLREILAPALRGARCPAEMGAENFLATIRDESGLVTGFSGEEFGFLHLRFQEYLAARELRARVLGLAADAQAFRSAIDDELVARFGVTWWDEVFCLLFAQEEGKPLFAPFFAALLRTPQAAAHGDLVRDILRDAPYFDRTPFVGLLNEDLGRGLFVQRILAVEILRANDPAALAKVDLELYREATGSQIEDALAVLEAMGQAEEAGGVRTAPAVHVAQAKGLRIELVEIPAGSFRMGTPKTEEGRFDWEWDVHEVAVAAFRLARTPVTNAQYASFLEANPGAAAPEQWADERFNHPEQPVVGVSWEEALAFCRWAGLDLPTEAQWEYACRAGTRSRFWSGDGETDLSRVGWWEGNANSALHPVGEKPANPWGLLDMHGNVWEWCADWFPKDKKRHPRAWDQPDKSAPRRVVRGGCFAGEARLARSGCRLGIHPGKRYTFLGFRPAQVIS